MAEPVPEGELRPLAASDGRELYARIWKANGPTKARVLFLHGFSDHIGHTAEFFPTLAEAGIEVHGVDQRGWGRSVRSISEQGDTGGTPVVMADITSMLKQKLPSDVPLFLIGHSMGGGEVLYYAAHGPTEVVEDLGGILAIAPWIALHSRTQPSTFTVALGRFVARFFPRYRLKNKLDPSTISQDPVSNSLFEKDPLCHDIGTLQTFDGCLNRAQELNLGEAAPQPEVKSIWLGHGTGDLITSWEASEAYNRRHAHKDSVLKLYPGAYHALHIEPETRREYFQDVIDFILTRAKQPELQSKL